MISLIDGVLIVAGKSQIVIGVPRRYHATLRVRNGDYLKLFDSLRKARENLTRPGVVSTIRTIVRSPVVLNKS